MSDKKNYDPKLRAAMHEIESVCKKYDCGAAVILGSGEADRKSVV